MPEHREPTYVFSEEQVAEKSAIARRFMDSRTRLNQNVDRADNFLVKRFYNLNHNTYLEGALPAKWWRVGFAKGQARPRRGACVVIANRAEPGQLNQGKEHAMAKRKQSSFERLRSGKSQWNRNQGRELERRLNSADPGLEIVNPHAAGIDVGNESHYVAVPPTGCATGTRVRILDGSPGNPPLFNEPIVQTGQHAGHRLDGRRVLPRLETTRCQRARRNRGPSSRALVVPR
jgi:hypothetical protein